MINCRWGVNQLGIFARRENVRNPDVVVHAENIATDVLFGLRYPGGRRRGGSDWCAGQEAAREWWIEKKRKQFRTASDSKDVLIVAFIQMEVEGDELQRTRPVSVSFSILMASFVFIRSSLLSFVRAKERKKGTDGSSPQTTLITDSVYDIPGSESDHYGERRREGESGESPVCATCRREHEANRSAELPRAQTTGFSKANPPPWKTTSHTLEPSRPRIHFRRRIYVSNFSFYHFSLIPAQLCCGICRVLPET
ncbi:hypothetical protein ALC57_10329 [Trachymyrmex cornetzi]|uniref:Uncharacterized protein n=1 Tax=Trachymyrmex cornetzi TaxID=471704 RepID=A0A195DWT8_9HYME|nr:hypothetical protein ALC57_10329 [Trachymyrmex cornetzi]